MRISDWSSDVCSSDLGRILEDPVTIRVTVDGPGVRQAGMTVVVRGDAGLVVTEQRLLPAERGLDRVADLAAGRGRDRLVRVDARAVLVAGPGLGAAVRSHLIGVGDGVAEAAERAEEQQTEPQSLIRN